MMTQAQFLAQANKALTSHTVYGTGGFGASIGDYPSQADRYYKNMYDAVYKEDVAAGKTAEYAKKDAETWGQKVLTAAKNPPCWCFDCVGLVKGIIWGWNAVRKSVYGGAEYESNGCPDKGTGSGGLIAYCKDVSTDFSNIIAGEMLWIDGHVGIYIGNGEAIECTTAWKDCVQKTVVTNVRQVKSGEYERKWTKHGKLPWVEYEKPVVTSYSVVIENFKTETAAKNMKNALKVLGTDSVIIAK